MKTIKNYDNFLNEKNEITLKPFYESISKENKYKCEYPDPNYRDECVDFDYLLGRTFVNIDINKESDKIVFTENNGNIFELSHRQDCCEDVYIEDIDGDIKDLIGNPILRAEESSNRTESSEGNDVNEESNSYTWSYYKLATIKGSLTIRWFGTSNGCYAEKAFLYVIEDVENK